MNLSFKCIAFIWKIQKYASQIRSIFIVTDFCLTFFLSVKQISSVVKELSLRIKHISNDYITVDISNFAFLLVLCKIKKTSWKIDFGKLCKDIDWFRYDYVEKWTFSELTICFDRKKLSSVVFSLKWKSIPMH